MAPKKDTAASKAAESQATHATQGSRPSSRDRLTTLEDKVERVEDKVKDAFEKFDVMSWRPREIALMS